ncbi:MAG: hypothetical protein ACXABY_04305 [Candidatus Thorarchaeota archaeon]|jgi:hypothetical protein
MCLCQLIAKQIDEKIGYKVIAIDTNGDIVPIFKRISYNNDKITLHKTGWNTDQQDHSINLFYHHKEYLTGFHIYLSLDAAEELVESVIYSREPGVTIVIVKVEFDDVVCVGIGSKTKFMNGPGTTVVVARRFRILEEVSNSGIFHLFF